MGKAVVESAPGRPGAVERGAPATHEGPSQEEALALLQGRVPAPAALAPLLAQVRATFSDIEEDTLSGGDLPFDAVCFRDALALRLRLAAALARPGPAEAVNVLLAEVDVALDRLRAAEPAGLPAVLERLHLTRDALVQDAVTLSECTTSGGRAGPPADAPPQPLRREPAAPATGRVVAYSEQDLQRERVRGRRRNVQLALVLVLVLGSVGLFVRRASLESTPPPTVQGAPAGLSVREDSRGGLLVRSLQPGRLTPEALEWVSTYERRGYVRRALGADAFYLQPPPATAVTSNR